ncbi:MAG: TraB/GumN family protein [Bacteroidetes bacterium]|nr:TraB/GumN family protein [Bacteroidota bacterium]
MQYSKRILSLIFLLVFFLAVVGQSNQWPKTFLWRISGKGLTKPSFLYGTIHLKDKRLFYFGDSLYRCLEQAEGYALEIDLREAMDSMLNKIFQKREQELLSDVPRSNLGNDNSKKRDLVDSLFKNVKKGDKQSRKKLEEMRQEQVSSAIILDMPTFMDAYLYGIAKRQGKLIGAVEDVQDQLGIADELGNKLDTADLLESKDKLRITLEDMIKSYMAQDLNRIEEYDKKGLSDEMQDKLFLKRNIKMARRMDSLSRIHSFFFAVGAGHLPGDSGVINLLKKRGFTVEPIFANQRVSPDKYAARLNALPWQVIEDQDKLFKVEMPDKATDFTMLGELVKMKVNMDITTMTYYMVGQTIMNRNINKLDEAFKQIARQMGDPLPTDVKKITRDSIEGAEGIINSVFGFYKLQLWHYANGLYMIMVGNENKAFLFSEDINRFFQSFTINKKAKQPEEKVWVPFTSEEKAFSVLFPAKAKRNKAYERSAEKSNWDFTVYDCVDVNAGLYYMLQVRDIRPGFYLNGDSAFFAEFRNNMATVFKDTIKNEQFLFNGFPAMYFDGHGKEQAVFYRTFTVNRGNRIYILTVISSNQVTDDEDARKFFNSFSFTRYYHPDLKRQYAEDKSFYTSASYPIKLLPVDSVEAAVGSKASKNDKYISFDPGEVISYQVFKDKISPYRWYKNDSALYGLYKYNDDSVLVHRETNNGELKGIEEVLYFHDNNNRKIQRKFLNGDTLYTLLAFIPAQYINEERHRKFFEDFRVTKENTKTTVFDNKAKKLLTALLSKDSAVFSEAKEAIDEVSFDKEDLPLLHKALLEIYPDDSVYYGVSNKIENDIDRLADSSTVDFINSEYKNAGKNEKLKYRMLGILAAQKTKYSYDLLKQLLLSDPPAKQNEYYGLHYRMADSLELCQSLYPEYLKLSSNKYLWNGVVYNTNKLLDSNRISLSVVLPYKNNFLYSADTVLKSLRKLNDEEEGYEYSELIELLGKFNDSKSNQLLKQYQKLKNVSLKQPAVIALLRNNQLADVTEINKLAEDKSTRKDFYDKLKEIHKEKFFPAKYLTQRYFAESEIYGYAYDDYEPSAVEYKGERIIDFDGSKQKFYLFKVVYEYEEGDEPDAYLGIAGPYTIADSKKLETTGKGSGLYYEKKYDPELLNELFKSFMNDREKSLKEHPDWYK